MTIKRFISEQKINIILQLIVLLCINIYLLILDVGTRQQGDIIYLDVLLITFYLGGFYVSYKVEIQVWVFISCIRKGGGNYRRRDWTR